MSIKNLTRSEAREKLGVKQQELGKIFEEAKTDSGEYDFRKVKCLPECNDSIGVAEKVKALNSECDELAQHAETLEAAEQAAAGYKAREKGLRSVPLPGGGQGGGQPANEMQFKSLGQRVVEEKAYSAWAKGGAAGGLTLNFDDMLPSEFLAKAAQFETLGNKALMSTTAGYAPESIRMPGFVEAATRPLQLLDIIPMSKTDQSSIKYMEETTRAHAAAERAEGAAFAESEFAFTEKDSPVKKITDSLPITDEQLEDVAFMESYVNGRLSFGVRQRLDGQCAVGDGTGTNLRGLKSLVGIQTEAKGADPSMEAFYRAMVKIRLVGRAIPTHHVSHPNDWMKIRLTRTADGIYIFGSPTEAGPERLWGLPMVQQDADVEGRGYTGSFQPAWVTLSEKKGVDIQLGYVGTQFAEGKRTARADMRAALTFFRPAAFCELTGLNA